MKLPLRGQARFPWVAPTRPVSVDWEEPERTLGLAYDGAWSRRRPARMTRALFVEGVVRPLVHTVTPPEVHGADRLDNVEGPVIFAPNHNSHLDTALMLAALPRRFRHRTVFLAAADYFFDTRWKAAASSLALAAVPIDRSRVSRRSIDIATGLLAEGWNAVIYPEGGRSPDRWARAFQPGAAFLSLRTGAPVVPVYLKGTGEVLGKDSSRFHPGRTAVVFGSPIAPTEGDDPRALSAQLSEAVAVLADEEATDWWQARRRAARSDTPSLSGPEASPWRRAWARPQADRPAPSWPRERES
ncbi:MAG TPA: lysophospholipid acyltransferase family protein [Acidimicrobiales bacterium]|nr:lysophospholipid acyltransferase family protein [Acidimicrobiales bacterium]